MYLFALIKLMDFFRLEKVDRYTIFACTLFVCVLLLRTHQVDRIFQQTSVSIPCTNNRTNNEEKHVVFARQPLLLPEN